MSSFSAAQRAAARAHARQATACNLSTHFDTIVVGSRKPSFFKTSSPPFEVIPETEEQKKKDE